MRTPSRRSTARRGLALGALLLAAAPAGARAAPWRQPFSLVAGGGSLAPAAGLVAGDADLGRVWGGARDGAGRVLVDSTRGLWVVGADGRLAPVTGVPARVPGDEGGPLALAPTPDGRILIARRGTSTLLSLAPASTAAVPLLQTPVGVQALAPGTGGRLLAVLGDEQPGESFVDALDGTTLIPGPRLPQDPVVTARAVAAAPDGVLVTSWVPELGADGPGRGAGDPEDGRSATQLVRGADAPPPLATPTSARSLVAVAGGRTLIAADERTERDLDTTPISFAAAPALDRQSFGSGEGENYYGYLTRRRELLREPGGQIHPTRWAGPPADALAPDGPDDVLVASAGRLWSTRPGLGLPDVRAIDRGRVTFTFFRRAHVVVRVTGLDGHLRTRAEQDVPGGGGVSVALPGRVGRGTVRVQVLATEAGGRATSSSAYAFAGAGRFTTAAASAVLRQVARRLYVGFEYASSHGVDHCAARGTTTVACRWRTIGSQVKPTYRTVLLTRSPAGYLLRASATRPGPKATGPYEYLLGRPRPGNF